MEREEVKRELDVLALALGDYLDATRKKEAVLEAIKCVELIDGFQRSLDEVQDHWDSNYRRMDANYWEGVHDVMEILRRNVADDGLPVRDV